MVRCFYCRKIAPYVVSAEIEIVLTGLPEQKGFISSLDARICPGCMDQLREDTKWAFSIIKKEDTE